MSAEQSAATVQHQHLEQAAALAAKGLPRDFAFAAFTALKG